MVYKSTEQVRNEKIVLSLAVSAGVLFCALTSVISGVVGHSRGFDEGFETGIEYPVDNTMRVYNLYDWEAVTNCIHDGEREPRFNVYDPELAPTCMTYNLNR